MQEIDIVCVGDAIIDAFLSLHDANSHCRLDNPHEICFQYGAKIPLDDCKFLLGGNGANISVGLSRLGYKTALMAEIGTDEFCEKIKKILEREGVSNKYIQQTKDAPSTFSVIINFKGERTIFTKHITRDHDFYFDGSFSWLYLTSLGNEWRRAYQRAMDFVQKTGVKLAFNPGILQLDEGVDEIIKILSHTEILFVNKQEAETVLGEKPDTCSTKELLQKLSQLGPKNVMITDGLQGSYAINQDKKMYFCIVFPSSRIEVTGAGDAYATGVLGAIMDGKTFSDAMKWGTINAASVIGKIGAEEGLLTRGEIEKQIEEHKEWNVEELND